MKKLLLILGIAGVYIASCLMTNRYFEIAFSEKGIFNGLDRDAGSYAFTYLPAVNTIIAFCQIFDTPYSADIDSTRIGKIQFFKNDTIILGDKDAIIKKLLKSRSLIYKQKQIEDEYILNEYSCNYSKEKSDSLINEIIKMNGWKALNCDDTAKFSAIYPIHFRYK